MEELSDYSGEIIEFKTPVLWEKQEKLFDNCTSTDVLPPSKDVAVETNAKCDIATQTQTPMHSESAKFDEKKLALWLRKIYPNVEAELLKGPTPIIENYIRKNTLHSNGEMNIQTYQKLSYVNSAGQLDNSQGLATWLSVHTNNAPVLVISTTAPHDGWCEHVNRSIRIFVPKRVQASNFIVFTEMKSVPIKACLRVLATNPYNKSIFVGSTLDGDIYIWQFEQSSNEVNTLFNFTATRGFATAIDWPAENLLLTCHSNGYITQWLIAKEVDKEAEYVLQPPFATSAIFSNSALKISNDITTLVCLNGNDFVVGTKDGGVYHCWMSNVGTIKRQLEITPLKRHLFMVSSLLKTKTPGYSIVISCDLSGQVYYHDIQNIDDDGANVMMQIPLPFKNSIACSRNGNIIYCPSTDGSLECLRYLQNMYAQACSKIRIRIRNSDAFWCSTSIDAFSVQLPK